MMAGIVAAQRVPRAVAKYWRVQVTGSSSVDNFKAQIAEVEFRATTGGADQANGGVALASTTYGSPNTPDAAFDGLVSTSWSSASGTTLPQWVGYEFVNPVSVAEVLLTAGDNSTRALRMPTSFTVDYSSDGTYWVTACTYAGLASWSVSESRAFSVA